MKEPGNILTALCRFLMMQWLHCAMVLKDGASRKNGYSKIKYIKQQHSTSGFFYATFFRHSLSNGGHNRWSLNGAGCTAYIVYQLHCLQLFCL
jgi:trehalose utilization protein